jgi:adenylate kinase family enzyme
MDVDLRRVSVVGTSCCGKTTFATRLAALLGCPHLELDALHWGPKWTPRSDEEFLSGVQQGISVERWVVDGNYHQVRDLIWARATAVVWLDYPFRTVLARALSRTCRRVATKEAIYAGNRESVRQAFLSRESILLWVLTTFHRRRRRYRFLKVSGRYPSLQWIVFCRPSEAAAFLGALETTGIRHPSSPAGLSTPRG